MKNMVILGTGNSRYLKTSLPEGTTWEEALAMMREGSFPMDFNGLNPFGYSQRGTQLDTETLMPDTLANKIATLTGTIISQEPTPANQLSTLVDYLDGNTISHLSGVTLELDSMDKTGYVFLTLGQSEEMHYPDDAPSTGKALLIVINRFQQISQIFITGSAMWTRLRENTSDGFGPWVRWVTTNDLATTTASGLMSAADKAMMENSVVRGSKPAPTGATSLDDFTTSGIYWVSSSVYTTGWPSGISGYAVLNVFYDGGGARIQELTTYSGTGENKRFVRMYINAQWYPWRPIATGAGTAWDLDLAPQITANSDLNNMKTPGNFASPGNITSTLTNAPPVSSGAFILKVMAGHVANAYVQQAIDVTGAAMFLRYFNTSNWGSWYKYTGTAV